MASFSKKLPLKYKELDYDSAIGNYNWLQDTIASKFDNIEKPECNIAFQMGDISCSCKSIEEFSKIAYGQIINVYSYDLSFIQINHENNRVQIAYVIISDYLTELTVFCDSKENLIKICTALENSMKPESSISNTLFQAEKIQYIHDESTHVTMGDHSTIRGANIGKNNMIKTEAPAPKESFWKPVLQMITANWLWFVLGLTLIVALGNTDWMNIF